MSDPYDGVKGGKLTFKGGGVAASSKSIDKKKTKKNKSKKKDDVPEKEVREQQQQQQEEEVGESAEGGGRGEVYTIDAAKRMKYEQLFPVEAKKFGYQNDPKSNFKSVEEALDDRVKKKADRYCK